MTAAIRLLLLSLLGILQDANSFSIAPPKMQASNLLEKPCPVCHLADDVSSIPYGSNNRIRRITSLPFKPDDSVELYGGDEDEEDDEEEDSSVPEQQEPDLEFMATFLANRLGRAYLRSKLQSIRKEQSKAQEENTEAAMITNVAEPSESNVDSRVGDFQKTLVDVQEAQSKVGTAWNTAAAATKEESDTFTEDSKTTNSDGVAPESEVSQVDDAVDATIVEAIDQQIDPVDKEEETEVKSEAGPIIVPPAGESKGDTLGAKHDEEEKETKEETLHRELLERQLEDKSVKKEEEPAAKGLGRTDEPEKELEPVVISESDKQEENEIESVPAEVPSLMHEKEGDRNIGLRDDFVDTLNDDLVDGEKEVWNGIPEIPKEISLEFGRPLQVVKDGLPPIRS